MNKLLTNEIFIVFAAYIAIILACLLTIIIILSSVHLIREWADLMNVDICSGEICGEE
jgi:hypothetical protein